MKIIILGDVLLDINYYCNTTRFAPEANIPVYNTLNMQYILGGASNVAKNIAAFGCHVEMISVIGDDSIGLQIKTMLDEDKIQSKLFVDNKRKTTQKNRIFYNNDLVTRYDIEDIDYINSDFENKIIEHVKKQNDIDAIIFSDYGKGFLTKKICETIIEYSNVNKILTFVDPKTIDAIKFKGCFCFKSNLPEGEVLTGKKNVSEIIEEMKQKFECNHVILTCGENGMYVNSHNNHIYHKSKLPVVDVTGCGDVVLSVLTYCYLQTADIIYSSKVANYVAGKCVCVIGNYTVAFSDLNEFVDIIINDNDEEKIKLIKNTDKKVVFTNGCFDVIHSAHIRLLQFSKKQGDILVVGLNTDESIKRFKGDSRPINNIEERCELLKNLGFIDHIIIFNDDTPEKILSLLKPNVLIKGGDYTKESIIGKEYADQIIIYNYIDGLSSTNVIKKIRNM
jgi:D-beta-D-heptose 7-phosphate kinase/D-beta-D-heptose 1-phosphate adenosyltransferase